MAEYIDKDKVLKTIYDEMDGYYTEEVSITDLFDGINKIPIADVVPKSEVEELQKKLDDYKKFVGEIRVTCENHAVIIDTEHTEYIDKRVAEGFKNMAIKQAKQEVARVIFAEIDTILKTQEKYLYCNPSLTYVYELIAELKKKYIGE